MLLVFAHCDTQMSPNMGAHNTGEIESYLPDVPCKHIIACLWHFPSCGGKASIPSNELCTL